MRHQEFFSPTRDEVKLLLNTQHVGVCAGLRNPWYPLCLMLLFPWQQRAFRIAHESARLVCSNYSLVSFKCVSVHTRLEHSVGTFVPLCDLFCLFVFYFFLQHNCFIDASSWCQVWLTQLSGALTIVHCCCSDGPDVDQS